MCRDIKKQLISINLRRIKEAVKNKRGVFIDRDVNKKTLQTYSLSIDDVLRIISGLSVDDYCKGPENDHNDSDGFIWVFHHPVSDCTMYIKLKLFTAGDEDWVKILSFHN